MLIKTCAITLLTIFSLPPVLAYQRTRTSVATLQNPAGQYLSRTWTSEQGLPQNSVQTVIQTADGFLWIGTQVGLARFDGSTFKVFNKKNVPAMKDVFINHLLEARDGTLWMTTQAGGLVAMNKDAFKLYTTEQGLLNNSVDVLCEDHEGSLWIGSRQKGLYKFKDGRITDYTNAKGLASKQVWAIFEDRSKVLWIGTTKGLTKFENGQFTTLTKRDGLSDDYIQAIWQDSSNALWIGTLDGGLNIYKDGHFKSFSTAQGLPKKAVTVIYGDRSGTMWVGTYAGGLHYFDGVSFKPFITPELSSTSIIMSIYEDHEGNLWVGTGTDGLHRLKKSRVSTYNKQTGLSADAVWGMCEDRKGNIWIALDGGGANKLKNGVVTSYSRKNGLIDDNVYTLMEDHTGTLWFGTDLGISKWKDGVFTSLSPKDGYPANVEALYEDRENRIWIGADTLFKLEHNVLTKYTANDGYPNAHPLSLLEDHTGALWIATDGDGVLKFVNGTFTNYTTKDGLTDNIILCLYEDQQGKIWAGTNGGGINRFSDGEWKAWTEQTGLPDGVIYKILKDDFGTCWMSSNHGVFSVPEQKLIDFFDGKINSITPLVLDRSDGMGSNECSGGLQSAGFKDSHGIIWFPTVKGAVAIDPKNVQNNAVPPLVTINEVKVDDGIIIPRSPWEIPPGMERIEFHYAGLSFTAPGKVQYQYRLDGFDKAWINADHRRTAYYTSLAPGMYTFWVRACNNDGVWNETGTSFTFTILPHYYQTRWFYVLGLLWFVGIGFTLYRIRLWQLLRREKELTSRVEEAMKKIKVLGGLIPICSHCKKIRDDKGYWSQLEQYLNEHSEASFSHGICPECAEKHYGDLLKKKREASKNLLDPHDLENN